MLHRARWSVVLALCVAGSVLPFCNATAQASDLTIRFDQIEAHVRAESPRAHVIAQELVAIEAERDDAVQRSNPELAYDHEEYEDFREWQLTLHKRFDQPFTQGGRRDGWTDRVRSAELQTEQAMLNLVAGLEAGYVRLQLLDAYMLRIASLAEMVELASEVADERHEEGEISGVEKRLIQRTAFLVHADHRRARQARQEYGAVWNADMGVPPTTAIELTTPIVYQAVAVETARAYAMALDDRPGMQAQAALAQSWSRQADAARPSLVPGFSIYGGYKQVGRELEAFAAGVALDLPLFQWNAGAARRHEAQQRIVETELAMSRARFTAEIGSLVEMIESAQPSLESFADQIGEGAPLTDALLLSYREGSLSLEAFLNSIQIESAALESYYDQLATYYENIFRLEAITGVSLVQFAP